MIIRTLALTGLLGLGIGTAIYAPPSEARTFVSVRIAPPAPRHESVVVRPGYEWAPGYWRWSGRRYVWANGYYVHVRPGQRWHSSHWERHENRWHYREGYWHRR